MRQALQISCTLPETNASAERSVFAFIQASENMALNNNGSKAINDLALSHYHYDRYISLGNVIQWFEITSKNN